jgi:hypothetical protein
LYQKNKNNSYDTQNKKIRGSNRAGIDRWIQLRTKILFTKQPSVEVGIGYCRSVLYKADKNSPALKDLRDQG